MSTSYSFDVAVLLDIGAPFTDPLPGEIVLRIPAGLTLQQLRDSPVGKRLMHAQAWYNKYPWSQEALPAVSYRLRIPVPNSNRKTAEAQDRMLPEGETSAPVVLVAVALLCIALQEGPDPLQNDWTRCLEQTVDSGRVGLTWSDGRLLVNDDCWDGCPSDVVWSSSVRTS